MEDLPIALDDSAKARIAIIATENGVSEYEVARSFIEEGALTYFRHRKDDPAKPPLRL